MFDDSWLWQHSTTVSISILTFITLFKTSARFRYIVKFGYLFISYNSLTPILGVLCIPWPRNPYNGAFISKIMKPVNSVTGVRWSLEGEENLHHDGGALVILNHQSVIDVMALFEIWPHLKKAAPVAKKSIFYTPFGICAWLIGTVFIDRRSVTSRDDVNDAGKRAMASGTKLMIFPEGTRNGSKGMKLLPFKKGAFHVALASKAPIIPVVIKEYDFLDYRFWKFDSGEAVIRVLPPIETDSYDREHINDLIKLTEDKMREALQDLGGKKDL